MEGSPREPAHGCSNQAELRTENECTRMEGSPREPTHGCSNQAELGTENECTRMEGSPREPANGCSNQAELGTGIRTHPPRRAWKVRRANRRTVASTKPSLERKMNATAWKVRPANRRTVAPTKPSLERGYERTRPAGHGRFALRTGERLLQPSRTWNGDTNAPAPPGMEGSLREPAHGCSNQANLRTENECNRVDTSFCCNLNLKDERNEKTENPQHRKRVG